SRRRHHRRAAAHLHRPRYGPPRDPEHRLDFAPFADLLLQPQQAPCPDLRRQPGRHARATRSCGGPERGGGLAICPPRRRRHRASASGVAEGATLAGAPLASSATGLKLASHSRAEAPLGLVPMARFVAPIGYLAAGWLRSAADTGLISFLLAAWFVITLVGPEL